MFRAKGLKKGDFVMTMLNRRYEYYIVNVACCKLGLVLVPATYLLTVKDIAYRVNAADVKAVICINEDEVIEYVEEAAEKCPGLKYKFTIGKRVNFLDLHEEAAKYSDVLEMTAEESRS